MNATTKRRKEIATWIQASEFSRIQDLADRFGVSSVTIRTDLDFLEERGHVVRVHGGAIPSSPLGERAFETREAVALEEKLAIAEAAVTMLKPGDTLILDVGTTTVAIARALVAHTELENLVAFTNGLNVALALEPAIPRVEVMVTGGHLRPLQHSLVEPRATQLLQDMCADYAFIGCDGIHPSRGVTTTNFPEATMKQAMLRAAHTRVVVADSGKFHRQALATVCAPDDVDLILTSGQLDPDVLNAFAESSVEIRVAPTAGGEAEVHRFPAASSSRIAQEMSGGGSGIGRAGARGRERL